MENFKKITKQQSPARTIAFGFAVLIFIGAALLSLPIAVRGAVQLPGLDALFTATSAVCVTGLVTVDPGDTFTLFGQAVLAVLMQLGGLGISSVSMGLAIAAGRRISFRGRSLVREALNVESFGGMVKLVRSIMAMTLLVEGIGAVASYPVFARDYSPLHAAWISVFHAIASFNNAGLDVLGGGHSLIPYCNNLWLNLVTDGMIVLGGIGFMVMLDVLRCRGRFRKLTLHSKVVLSTTAVLILGGAMLLADRADQLFGGAVPKHHHPHGGLFHHRYWCHDQCRAAGDNDLNVHRRVAWVYGRRHQDHHLFCADAGGAHHLLQAQIGCVQAPPAGGKPGQSRYHHAAGHHRGVCGHLLALRAGAAAQLCAAAV